VSSDVDGAPSLGHDGRVPIPYDAFAPHFDAWQRSFGVAYDDLILPRIVRLLERHAPAARRIVDLGVGTGDLAIALARRGYEVVGVDRAPAMLAVARGKAAEAGVAIELMQQDLRSVGLAPPADVALCVYTVVNQQTDDGDLARMFHAVRRALVPGGLFVFELNLPASYACYWVGEDTADLGDAVIVREHRRVPGSPVIEARVSIRRRTCGGFDETIDHVAQRPYDDAEVAAALASGGFALVDRETYDPFEVVGEPTKCLWVCRRR
jgi:SAM-dependent methyltransferase